MKIANLFATKSRSFMNHRVLNPYGDLRFLLDWLVKSRWASFLPTPILSKIVRSLKRLGCTVDAERVVISHVSKKSKYVAFDMLISMKSYIKALSIFPERDPEDFVAKHGVDRAFVFANAMLKCGNVQIAKDFFFFMNVGSSSIIFVKKISIIEASSGNKKLAQKLLLPYLKHKKFTLQDAVFFEYCRLGLEGDGIGLEEKYGI